MGEVNGNKWWGSLEHRIRDFAIRYRRQLNLDRTKVTKFLEVIPGSESRGFPSQKFS